METSTVSLHDVLTFLRENGSTLTVNERKSIIAELNVSAQIAAHRAKAALCVGDAVTFPTKGGKIVKGVVKKINTKNVDVWVAEVMQTWRVAPTLLKNAA